MHSDFIITAPSVGRYQGQRMTVTHRRKAIKQMKWIKKHNPNNKIILVFANHIINQIKQSK